MPLMTLLTSITFGRLGCLRPYANNCSVSVAARRPAFAISRRSSRRGSFASNDRSTSSVYPRIAVS